MIAIGLITAGAGLYFTLIGAGVLPPPKGGANAPGWIVVCAGLAFLLGGIAVLRQAIPGGEVGPDGKLPDEAPRWMHVMHHMTGVAVLALLAAIGSWVAFGPGPRSFTASSSLTGSFDPGEWAGRVAFGLGALLVWLFTIAFAVRAARKAFGWPKRERAR